MKPDPTTFDTRRCEPCAQWHFSSPSERVQRVCCKRLPAVMRHIGKGLERAYEGVVHEPLPERLAELAGVIDGRASTVRGVGAGEHRSAQL